MIEAAVFHGAAGFAPMLDAIRARVDAADKPEDLDLLADVVRERPDDMAEMLARAMFAAELEGRASVEEDAGR